ncbi:tryptophan halogenase family protein [Sphingomicrobium astaxanthinifaciens]|uniref:tryptophan halogenase family protein n=1 Tax=Sphingomicrobium astaxanthinifaciens TaxID=1227949 RepID=UPI001FCA5FB8|nr:tryptophan halogenase family protein [Sphingomicrobium astaxanthinifaciens]MCJ7421437.1 tryptophan 7-halogenase [Sphingomicrobium astaxanthinifaciens]
MPIKKIVIVGGGTAGWMAAAALSRLAQSQLMQITLVESELIGTVGVGEATIPPFLNFNDRLGIDEAELLAAVQGSFKLGIHFVNWESVGDSYFHPFGNYGYAVDSVSFHEIWMRYRMAGDTRPLHQFSPETMAAMHRRFMHQDEGAELPAINYAYHLDATAYARFLRRYAEARGVVRKEGKIVTSDLHGESGFVRSVTLEDGAEIEGDFFIDCSGFRGLLIEDALETGYEEWTHWLPCDRAVAIPSRGDGTVLPYTRATAHSAGWQWRVPLQRRNGNGHVYCSSFMEADEATRILLDNVDGEVMAEPNHLRFVTGRRKKFWNKNVVAVGLSGGFMEPLESTSIHLIQSAIAKLAGVLSLDGVTPAQEETFNRLLGKEFSRIRDFLILHYKATKRDDSEFWNYCRTMDIPDTLQEKIDLFRLNGQVFREEDELFAETSWVAVMMGQGIVPGRPSAMAHSLDLDKLREEYEGIDKSIRYVVGNMPTHDQYLERYCPAAMAAE